MEIVKTLFYTIIALGVLVSFHEYGHFWVARRCGIKVLRFSIGFGKPLVTWTDKQGTEYVIAWLPLGGYVRMVDEREDDVAEADLPYAFNRKSVWQRMAVVVAGPAANFLLAVVVYWMMFIQGVAGYAAIVGEVVADSIADRAGLRPGMEIVAVDGVSVTSLQKLQEQIVLRLGESSEISFTARERDSTQASTYSIELRDWVVDSKKPDMLRSIGIVPTRLDPKPILGEILAKGAAEKAELQPGDLVTAVDGVPVSTWSEWSAYVQKHPGETIAFGILRGNERLTIDVTPDTVEGDDGQVVGRVGVALFDPNRRLDKYGAVDAIAKAAEKTWDTSVMILGTLKKMITGHISAEHLSGPITIAKVAGQSAEQGLVYFLWFIGMLSVSLGILNLLPIPVLDGGHLMYYIIEAIKGSPVSENVQMVGYKIGLFLVMGLMVFALYNDVLRLG